MASPADSPPLAYVKTVDDITRIYKSLPPRPSIEEVEAAVSVLHTVEAEEKLQLEEISVQVTPDDVSPELFSVLLEVKKSRVAYRSLEQRKEAAYVVEVDRIFQVFDGLLLKASDLVSGDSQSEIRIDSDGEVDRKVVIGVEESTEAACQREVKSDDGLKGFLPSRTSDTISIARSSGEGEEQKLDLMKVASVIENSYRKGSATLDLRGKLMDRVEWLPLSLGKLSALTKLYLSENRIMALPTTLVDLHALMKLDVHGNQLINLPTSFGELQNLTDLDLSGNMLKSLPESFGNLKILTNLDLSLNRFSKLPDIIGDLSSLQRLNVGTNDLEELPHAIGSCSSLIELRLDFNQLKALPEAIGKLERLEILTVHYNRVKRLPSTMGNLLYMRELDVSFNELEGIPETLCLEVSLKKLNVAQNFADLRKLPESLGNLEMLEELDISDNQIKGLPDSFRFMSRLRIFKADQTPLEVPPKHIAKLGAEAVVQYMAEFVAERDANYERTKKERGIFSYICPLLCFGIGRG